MKSHGVQFQIKGVVTLYSPFPSKFSLYSPFLSKLSLGIAHPPANYFQMYISPISVSKSVVLIMLKVQEIVCIFLTLIVKLFIFRSYLPLMLAKLFPFMQSSIKITYIFPHNLFKNFYYLFFIRFKFNIYK